MNTCTHVRSHLNNELTGARWCNDCATEFDPDGSGRWERWRIVDELTDVLLAGVRDPKHGAVRVVWKMLDALWDAELLVLRDARSSRR